MIAKKVAEPTKLTNARNDDADALLDEALQMTFPASDPIAISFDHGQTTGLRKVQAGQEQQPRSRQPR